MEARYTTPQKGISSRYDYNKFLQTAAADRIHQEGLNNAR